MGAISSVVVLKFRKHTVSFSSKSWTRSSIDLKLHISPEKLLSRSEKSSRPDAESTTFEFSWSNWSADVEGGLNSLKSCQSSSNWANGAAMTAVKAGLRPTSPPERVPASASRLASGRWGRESRKTVAWAWPRDVWRTPLPLSRDVNKPVPRWYWNTLSISSENVHLFRQIPHEF